MMTNDLAEEYAPIQGPLPKSIYTVQLEVLTRKLLSKQKYKVARTKNATGTVTFIDFFDDLGNITDTYNLSRIIKYATFDHLKFDQNDFDQYNHFLSNTARWRSGLKRSRCEQFASTIDHPLYGLDFAEMQAINIYTGNYYSSMNSFMRGKYRLTNQNIEVILHSVFCASGLAKIHSVDTVSVTRSEAYNKQRYEAFLKAHETQRPMLFRGFVSTTIRRPTWKNITLEGVRGKFIRDISRYPAEQEYLLNPTWVQIDECKPAGSYVSIHGYAISDLGCMSAEPDETQMKQHDLLARAIYELGDYTHKQLNHLTLFLYIGVFFFKKTRIKYDGFKNCLQELEQLRREFEENQKDYKELSNGLDQLSRKIEDIATIQRRFKKTTFASHKFQPSKTAVERVLKDTTNDDPVENDTLNPPTKKN